MRRREFIALLGSVAASGAHSARAQVPAPRIGFINTASPAAYAHPVRSFHQGLSESGYAEGQNVAIEYRWADGRYERLPDMMSDLLRHRVSLIVANGPAAPVAKAVTSTIPIVFTAGFDPIKLGLVSSLSRPGGNVTGATILNVELGPKRIEMLHQSVPAARLIGFLMNPDNPNVEALLSALQLGARTFGLETRVLRANTASLIDKGFAQAASEGLRALVIGTDPFFTTRSEQLGALTLRHTIGTAYQYREFVAAGGLLSYGGSMADAYRQARIYAGRILKGERPADLPVVQSTKVELIINLRTAKTLGIEVPPSLLVRADEVIE